MLPDSLAQSPRVYTGVRFDVHRVELTGSDGQMHARDLVVHPGSVLIIPVLDGDHLVLIRSYRFSADETLWELPAGTIEPAGEEPLRCATREIIEETGYEAKKMTHLLTFFACPGISTEQMHMFLAEDLTQVGQDLDASEQIEPKIVRHDEAMRMVRDGEIRDGKTLAGLLYYDRIRNK